MKPSGFYLCIVDMLEELVKFTLLTRDNKYYLVDHYSNGVKIAKALIQRVNQTGL